VNEEGGSGADQISGCLFMSILSSREKSAICEATSK